MRLKLILSTLLITVCSHFSAHAISKEMPLQWSLDENTDRHFCIKGVCLMPRHKSTDMFDKLSKSERQQKSSNYLPYDHDDYNSGKMSLHFTFGD